MTSTAMRLATSPAECPPIPSHTSISDPLLWRDSLSAGRIYLLESSFTSRTHPTSVKRQASISQLKSLGAAISPVVFSDASPAVFRGDAWLAFAVRLFQKLNMYDCSLPS